MWRAKLHVYFDGYFHPFLLFKCYASVQRGDIPGLYYKNRPFTLHILHLYCFSDKEAKKLFTVSVIISFTESAPPNIWTINARVEFDVKKCFTGNSMDP